MSPLSWWSGCKKSHQDVEEDFRLKPRGMGWGKRGKVGSRGRARMYTYG